MKNAAISAMLEGLVQALSERAMVDAVPDELTSALRALSQHLASEPDERWSAPNCVFVPGAVYRTLLLKVAEAGQPEYAVVAELLSDADTYQLELYVVLDLARQATKAPS